MNVIVILLDGKSISFNCVDSFCVNDAGMGEMLFIYRSNKRLIAVFKEWAGAYEQPVDA
jgi:hypothetical protein